MLNRLKRYLKRNQKVNIYKEKVKHKVIENPKKISVVIPNYNYENYIIERIDSVLRQTYPIYELIILDDNSKDNSVSVIEEKIKTIDNNISVKFLPSKVNSGNVFNQWQKAFALAEGDFLWIAEADDSCSATFLEHIMEGFKDPDVIMSYCESLTTDEDNNILMPNLREWIDIYRTGKWNQDYIASGKEELESTLCINNTIANVSSLVFRKIDIDYDKILEVSKEFRLAGDWYFYSVLAEYGKIAYCKKSLNYHRMQKKSVTLTTNGKTEYEEICRIQDDIMKRHDLKEEVKKQVYDRRLEVKRRLHVE